MTKLLSTAEAAEYLGLGVSGFKYHVYIAGNIKPARYFGRSPAFSQESLDEFEQNKRGPGRPRRKEQDDG